MAKASGEPARPDWLPDWLPEAARFYLEHTAKGVSLRVIARHAGCHPSTVLRHVRRFETRRDDPLIDAALDALSRDTDIHAGGATAMTAPFRPDAPATDATIPPQSPRRIDEETLGREARRILRRLVEPGAVLVLGADFERAVVLRDGPGGEKIRTGVLDQAVAQAFALKDWIACRGGGRVAHYAITAAGRAALRRFIEADAAPPPKGRRQAGWPRRPRPSRPSMAPGNPGWSRTPMRAARAGCAATSPKARSRFLAGGARRTAAPSSRPTSWPPPNGCGRISNSRRWGRASRRTGTAS